MCDLEVPGRAVILCSTRTNGSWVLSFSGRRAYCRHRCSSRMRAAPQVQEARTGIKVFGRNHRASAEQNARALERFWPDSAAYCRRATATPLFEIFTTSKTRSASSIVSGRAGTSVSSPDKYREINTALVHALPELREKYEYESCAWAEEMGPHVIYGDVLNPYLAQLLERVSGGTRRGGSDASVLVPRGAPGSSGPRVRRCGPHHGRRGSRESSESSRAGSILHGPVQAQPEALSGAGARQSELAGRLSELAERLTGASSAACVAGDPDLSGAISDSVLSWHVPYFVGRRLYSTVTVTTRELRVGREAFPLSELDRELL